MVVLDELLKVENGLLDLPLIVATHGKFHLKFVLEVLNLFYLFLVEVTLLVLKDLLKLVIAVLVALGCLLISLHLLVHIS